MKAVRFLMLYLLILGIVPSCMAVETGMFRLLSISESEKLILVSRTPDKTKYLLDIAAAKITVDGKPAEIDELKAFSVIQVKWNKKKTKRNGIDIDGTVSDIVIDTPGKDKPTKSK